MKTRKQPGACPKRFLISSLMILLVAMSSIMTGCSTSSGGGKFTATEKKAMTTKSAPPKEAMEMMSKTNMGKPTGNETSPWTKPKH